MPQRDGPRLSGRNGQVWRAYVAGRTQEAIAAEHGISQQRVSQVLDEVRAGIPAEARSDAAVVDLERLDALLVGVMPAAVAGDTGAVRAVLAVLERRARMLRLDLDEPLRISFEKHLDDQGQLIADAIGAAFDAVPQLSHEQRMLATSAAMAKLLGEPLPEPLPAAAPPVEADDATGQAKREAEFRRMMEADGVDADELLADDGDEEDGDA